MIHRRLLPFLLLALACTTMSATVKPRYRNFRAHAAGDAADESIRAPRRVGLHESAPLTSMGSPKVPVILVQFSDLKFISGLQANTTCETAAQCDTVNLTFDHFCNGLDNGSHYTALGSGGAIREYFSDQSDGQFTPEFVVIGPVTLDKSYTYYGENSGNSKDIHISTFYQEAISQAQAVYADWSQFDNDGNGSVDMAFFIFAGEGENALDPDEDEDATYHIWPKESANGGTINGVTYGAYACCNELYNGRIDGIGVFVHELSHALGLPDLYDTNYVAYGLDYWDIMDSGCYCGNGYAPCNYSAYERDFMGWNKLVTLDPATPQHLTLNPISSNGTSYKIVNPENEDEYYILENRQNKGWDTYIGRGTRNQLHHGLLVSHVDYLKSAWTANRVNTNASHQRLTLIPADGTLDSYMYVTTQDEYTAFMASAAGDPYPGTTLLDSLAGSKASVFTTTGDTPGEMGQPIYNITENADGTIELDYCQLADAIATVRTDRPAAAKVYNVAGEEVGTSSDGTPSGMHLPAGIYIVNQRKYIVR